MSNAAETEVIDIGPQPGPQTDFLSTPADLAIYGGAAGGGKSYALLLEPLRHFDNRLFGAVIFRRNSVQVRNEGGLWDESAGLYGGLGAYPRESALEHVFPSGMRVKFAHLEYDRSVLDWQGSQIPFIGFDELTHFSEKQFWYMLSRNRSASGVAGYIRATCNPDADSWVRKLIDWWINPDTGFAIPERSGVLRWFTRINDALIWGSSCEELVDRYGEASLPKSLTFIPSKLQDNQILMEKDPSYEANLNALSKVDRERLKDGNWNVRASAGMYFQREWFPVITAVPAGHIASIRFWDRAATRPNPENTDPDWTRGLKLLKYADGSWVVADLKSLQDSPGQVETLVRNVASHDGHNTVVMSQVDPGSAGVAESDNFIRMLAGFMVKTERMTKNKEARAKPVSAQAENGNVRVVRAPWNEAFFKELENFPEGAHDDIVDTLSGAFNELSGNNSTFDVL